MVTNVVVLGVTMFKRTVGIGLVLALAGCGGDDSGEGADAAVAEMPNTGQPGSGGASAGDMSMTGTTGGSGGSSASPSTPSASGDAGMMTPGQPSGSDDTTPPAMEGAMYGPCESDDDCGGALNCYEFGGYCSQACSADEDCAALGDNFGCSGAGGGGFPGGGGPGGFPGGGMADAGGMDGMATPSGVCRATCDGADDTSCPGGLTCISAGGGGGFMGGGGTFRCGIADAGDQNGDGMNAGSGTTPAFGECSNDGDCADGLSCTAGGRGGRGGGGSGYCTQDCDEDADCTAQAGGGTAVPTCGFGGSCALSCADDEGSCPDGMTCNSFGGGGGGGFAFCNY